MDRHVLGLVPFWQYFYFPPHLKVHLWHEAEDRGEVSWEAVHAVDHLQLAKANNGFPNSLIDFFKKKLNWPPVCQGTAPGLGPTYGWQQEAHKLIGNTTIFVLEWNKFFPSIVGPLGEGERAQRAVMQAAVAKAVKEPKKFLTFLEFLKLN